MKPNTKNSKPSITNSDEPETTGAQSQQQQQQTAGVNSTLMVERTPPKSHSTPSAIATSTIHDVSMTSSPSSASKKRSSKDRHNGLTSTSKDKSKKARTEESDHQHQHHHHHHSGEKRTSSSPDKKHSHRHKHSSHRHHSRSKSRTTGENNQPIEGSGSGGGGELLTFTTNLDPTTMLTPGGCGGSESMMIMDHMMPPPPPSTSYYITNPSNNTSPSGMSNTEYPGGDPTEWNCEDVFRFVSCVAGVAVANQFKAQDIDGSALSLVRNDHLVNTMQIKLGPALKIINKFDELKTRYAKQQQLNSSVH